MTKRIIFSLGLAGLLAVGASSARAPNVTCQTVGDRAICSFSFGDDTTSKEHDILYIQCVVSPKADYHDGFADINVDLWNTNVKSSGFSGDGSLKGLNGYDVNRLAFASKWQRNRYPQTVTVKIVKGHADLVCKSANVPTRPVYGNPADDSSYH